MKNWIKTLKRTALAAVAVYLTVSATYSIYFYMLLNDIYNSNRTYGDGFESRTSEELYDSLDFRSHYSDYGCEYDEHRMLLFPLTIHWFSGGKAFYMYSYTRRSADTGEILCGSWHIPVRLTFELDHGRVEVADKHEAP